MEGAGIRIIQLCGPVAAVQRASEFSALASVELNNRECKARLPRVVRAAARQRVRRSVVNRNCSRWWR